jgi:hypothetical protein
MSNAEMLREPAVETFRASTVDMKLEVVVIPSRTSIAPSASMATWVGGSTSTTRPEMTSG